jgi:general secretion pathway protein E
MNIDKLLLTDYAVSDVDLEKAKSYQQRFGGRLEKLLVNMGSLSEDALPSLYSTLFDFPILDNDVNSSEEVELPEWAVSLDTEKLFKYLWVPIVHESKYTFITPDPLEWEVNQYLVSQNIEPNVLLATKDVVESLAAALQDIKNPADGNLLNDFEEDRLRELASEAPTVNLLNTLISKGLKYRASDLHIEPVAGRYRIRFRVDGVLRDDGVLPSTLSLPVISRIKILSNMDIAEKRRPQDGKIETKVANTELDIRVSVLPVNKGESVVLRFLKKDSVKYDMDVLGISGDIRQNIEKDLKTTAGVILLTGPTGSGKTTSLYTFLNELNNDCVKIITLEDPVEYQLEGINQVQVNADIGFDFAAGLRSIVRQDPDIIMLGEIRDTETARIAMQSALTGHLVFSTVHTNDAPSAYTRLIDLGVEEFLLNAAVVSVMAQRLVRRVCPHCASPDDIQHSNDEIQSFLSRFGVTEPTFLKANGCDECSGTGYKGRMSIMEYLPCDQEIRKLPKDSYFIPEARRHNSEVGNRTLFEDGLMKASQGLTTIDEVMRVCA